MNVHPIAGRLGTAVGLSFAAIVLVVMTAAPASAHTVSGPRPTNYRTTLQSVSPRIPGVSVRIVDLGNKVELTNRTRSDVVVLGYDGEQFLRIGPTGVYENLLSPATYLNRTRAGTTPVPDAAQKARPSTPPQWHRISSGHNAIWHDHRVHWMGTSPPAAVQHDSCSFHRIKARWAVAMRYDNQPLTAVGTLDWVPGPSGWPWLPVIAGLAGLGIWAAFRKQSGVAIAIVVAIVGIDLAHTITAEVSRSGSQLSKIVQFFGDNFVSVIVWIAGAFTIRALRRGDAAAKYGLLFVGALVALVSGLSDLSSLWKSQLATVGSSGLARAEVAAGLGLGLGLAAGALAALLQSGRTEATHSSRDPHWLERLVGDLDDDAVAVVCSRMVADEVIPIALGGVAARGAPVAAAFGNDGLVFVVLAQDQIGSHVWSITAGTRGLRVQRGTPAPMGAEIRTTFPALLQLLAGTLKLEASIASGRLDVTGDSALVAAIEPYLGPDTDVSLSVATV